MKKQLAATTAMVCLLCIGVTPGVAQTASPDITTSPPPANTSKPTPATPQAGTSKTEDITVLGSHTRPLQHDSLPSTVFTKKDIDQAGIVIPQDFMRLTPGVTLSEGTSPTESQITIRGVAETYSQTAETPVGVFVDGIPLTAPNTFNQAYLDLQTIEIIKGPQNAIYGRNAIAGAIVINTVPPPDQLKASLTGTVTNGGGYAAIAKVGGPIVPDIALGSLVIGEDYLDGFYKNVTTGKYTDHHNNQNYSGRLLLTPTPDLTIDIKAGYAHLYGGGLAFRAQAAGNPYYNGAIPDVNNTSEPYASNLPNTASTERYNASIRADYRLDFGTISSISAYNYNRDGIAGESFPYIPPPAGQPDGTADVHYANTNFFQELKFGSDQTERFRYQLGADYYDFSTTDISSSGQTYNGTILTGNGPYPANSGDPTLYYSNDLFKTRAWEVFAEATYDITQQLSLDGAIRYSKNNVSDLNRSPSIFSNTSGLFRDEAYAKAEPRVTLTYKVTPAVNVYADWALGSLPGGFNATGSSAAIKASYPTAVVSDIYSQETSRNYEAGFNSQWFDRKLTLNGAVYYDLLTNQQFEQYYPNAYVEVTNTIDGERIYGGELEADIIPAPDWTVSAAVGLVHAEITALAADPTAVGHRPPNVPDFNLAFAINRNFVVTDKIHGFARFDDSVNGTQYWEADNLPGARTNVVNIANIRVGLVSGPYSVTAFVKNLDNNKYNIGNFVLSSSQVATYISPPRIYGLQATVGF